MTANRNKYTSAPMYGLKNKRPEAEPQGAGFTVPQAQKRPQSRHTWLVILLTTVLPVLFLVAFFVQMVELRWAFVALTAVCMLCMWVLHAFVESARSKLTVLYVGMAAVIGICIVLQTPPQDNQKNSNNSNAVDASRFSGSSAIDALLASGGTNASDAPANTGNVVAKSDAQKQLELFFSYWSENQIASMLKLCTQSWVTNQTDPERELALLLGNCIPLTYEIIAADGSDANANRTLTVVATVDKRNGQTPSLLEYSIILTRSNDVWYVDPYSLGGTPFVATPDPNAVTVAIVTATPTAPPADSTVLYYNAKGGAKYHAVAECADINPKFFPLAQFTYGELNNTTYKNLEPCGTCGAPKRPR